MRVCECGEIRPHHYAHPQVAGQGQHFCRVVSKRASAVDERAVIFQGLLDAHISMSWKQQTTYGWTDTPEYSDNGNAGSPVGEARDASGTKMLNVVPLTISGTGPEGNVTEFPSISNTTKNISGQCLLQLMPCSGVTPQYQI